MRLVGEMIKGALHGAQRSTAPLCRTGSSFTLRAIGVPRNTHYLTNLLT